MRLAEGESLLQKANLRGLALPGVTEVLTITNQELLFKTLEEYLTAANTGSWSAAPPSYKTASKKPCPTPTSPPSSRLDTTTAFASLGLLTS
eukprot:gene24075-30378_t